MQFHNVKTSTCEKDSVEEIMAFDSAGYCSMADSFRIIKDESAYPILCSFPYLNLTRLTREIKHRMFHALLVNCLDTTAMILLKTLSKESIITTH
jgi:hypothetical protein